MPIRTSAAAVKLVLAPGKDYDTKNNPDLSPFMDTASAITDDIVTRAVDNEENPLSDTKLELIERWLSAWAYVMSDQVEASASTGGRSASFQGQTGMGLKSNKYGQVALSLDTSGYLAAIEDGIPLTVDLEWGGKPNSTQIPYQDRD